VTTKKNKSLPIIVSNFLLDVKRFVSNDLRIISKRFYVGTRSWWGSLQIPNSPYQPTDEWESVREKMALITRKPSTLGNQWSAEGERERKREKERDREKERKKERKISRIRMVGT
jgi:hypothetical protein